MKIALRHAALALCAVCAMWADTYPRQAGIDAQHYRLAIALGDESDAIVGDATVTVRFVQAGVREFALDLASEKNGKGMTVDGVTEREQPIPYTHRAERLMLSLPSAPPPGALRSYRVRYHGVPAGGLLAVKNKYGERCFFSQNWPDLAHQWLPIIDHPYDKATSEFLIDAPATYQVVANGRLQEVTDLNGGRRLTHWKESVPIASWLNNIGVARFASLHLDKAVGVPLQTWVFPRDRDAGIATFSEPMRQALEFFSSRVGPYPYEKLAGVENGAADGGAMEHASAIFFGQENVTGRPALALVAHETAHQWFGDSVTEKDWDDVWLSEGFATYFTALAIEHYQGRDAFLDQMRRSRDTVFAAEKRLPGVAVIQKDPWQGIPNRIVYDKGGWTLHMLRGRLGAEKYWEGMREYYRRYRDGNASTADFERVMEDVSGTDLTWFFQQWLYRAGSPVVTGTWHYQPTTGNIGIDLVQSQAGEPYRLPLEIGITADGVTRIARIEMTQKHQVFQLPAVKEPTSVVLDPNVWTLMDAHWQRQPVSERYVGK